MLIILIVRSLDVGGSETQLVALAKGFANKGIKVSVMVLYPGGPLETELEEGGIDVYSLNKRNRWDNLGLIIRLILIIKSKRPDIIYSFSVVTNIISVILKPLFSSVRIIWGIRASYMDFKKYDWLSSISFKMQCLLSKHPDRIIFNSQAGFDYHLARGFPKYKSVVVFNGIDTKRFQPDPIVRRRVRSEWDINEFETIIGLIGRLDPMKDHETFLYAAAIVAKEVPNVYFVCVGDGPPFFRNKIKKLGVTLKLNDNIKWFNRQDNMPAIYNALDIAVSSSYGEGFSNIIGEAMACGVPCVVTNVGDSANIVGDTGIVVPPKSPNELAAGIIRMICKLKDKKKNMGMFARERILDKFNLETMVSNTLVSLVNNL